MLLLTDRSKEPWGARTLVEGEIAKYEPMCGRDHSSRVYVGMLRRIIGAPGDPHAEHERKMKVALAAHAEAQKAD